MNSSDKTFQDRFLRLSLENSEDSIDYDCEFVVGPESVIVKGHKLLFSAASEVFRAMFYGDLEEEKVVKVEDLDPEGFKGMKQYIYSGEVSFTSAIHALLTYASARKYMVPGLGKECIKYAEKNLQPSEVLEFYEYCKVYCISEFDDLCYKIIQEKTDKVVESDHFVTSKMESIELLMKSPSMKLESEIKVFVHLERWALAEAGRKNISSELIQSSFNNLKKHIRFLTMNLKEAAPHIQNSLLLTQKEKNVIMHNLIDYVNSQAMPEGLSSEQQHREFNALPVIYKFRHDFIVSIDIVSNQCFNYPMLCQKNGDMTIICEIVIGKYICFQFEYLKKNTFSLIKQILTINSRLRVLADKACDDLYFFNRFDMVLDWNDLTIQKTTFAKIPISLINNETFLKGTSNSVRIEASFNYDVENA